MHIRPAPIRHEVDLSHFNAMPDASAPLMKRNAATAGRRHPSFPSNLPRAGCGDKGPCDLPLMGCGVAVALPVGIISGAFKIAMIPLKTVMGAVGGCIAGAGGGAAVSAFNSESGEPGCMPVTGGAVMGCLGGTVAGSVGELLDVPSAAFGEDSLARDTYRAIAG